MLIRNNKIRYIAYQIIALASIAVVLYIIFHNMQTNLDRQGITTGFSFLNNTAGFDISSSLIEYNETDTYSRAFVVGLLNTLLVSFLGIIIASILGFILGIARLSSNWLVAKLSLTYIEIFRNIPLLLQIFFWYFAVLRALPHPKQSLSWLHLFYFNNRGLYIPYPELNWPYILIGLSLIVLFIVSMVGYYKQAGLEHNINLKKKWLVLFVISSLTFITYIISVTILSTWNVPALKGFNFKGGITLIPELLALWFALSIYTAAFIAEIVRSGIQAISKGQIEAANALGLTKMQALRLIIVPQAMRIIIPPLTNQYLNLTKNSSLAAAIAYPDLVSVFAGTALNQTGQAIEVIAITMGVYLLISLSISISMNWYQKRSLHWLVER